MAAGSPVMMGNAAATTTKRGSVLMAANVADITTAASSGTLPTADGSVTIADASTPTVAELLEYCVELETKVEAITAALVTSGAMSS